MGLVVRNLSMDITRTANSVPSVLWWTTGMASKGFFSLKETESDMCPRSPARDALHLRSFLFVLAPLFVLLGVTVGGVLAAEPGSPAYQETQQGTLELQNNTMEIDLQADGDAKWTVSWTFSLPEQEANDQFERLASEIESGERTDYLGTLGTIRNASQQLDAEQDREIRITNESWVTNKSGTGENATGRLSLSLTWENFARMAGDRLIVDDVLVTSEQGLWLESLTANQELIIRVPAGYGVIDANVDVQDRALRWQGPVDFDETTLQATFIGNRATPTPTPTRRSPILLWGLGSVFLVLGAAAVAYLWYRDTGQMPAPVEPETDGESPAGMESTPPDPPAAAAASDSTDDGEAEMDEELLSDEERVERLLEANGGRMKQADIVDETGWSNAKVSQLLSSMAEEERIDKLRIGRENLISFPDVDVTELQNDE